MIYSRQGRVLFVHVSRSGGSTLADSLRALLPDCQPIGEQHEPLARARRELEEEFDEVFKFAFVRNPWERFVSWFALIGQTAFNTAPDSDASSGNWDEPGSAHWSGFDEFLESWAADDIEIDGVRRRKLSQWGQLADGAGNLLTDEIGRFESFADDARRILRKAGLEPPDFPTTNASRHRHYSEYYSAKGRELVASCFREDVEVFGYEFEEYGGAGR